MQVRTGEATRALKRRFSSSPWEVTLSLIQVNVQAGLHLAVHQNPYGTPTVSMSLPWISTDEGPSADTKQNSYNQFIHN